MEDVMHGIGLLRDSERRYTKPYDIDNIDDDKIDDSKNMSPEPGDKVIIVWDLYGDEKEDEDDLIEDEGYILTLPGWDSKDIWMSGIIHIPKPEGCEKCDCDPQWIYINRLLSYDTCVKLIF